MSSHPHQHPHTAGGFSLFPNPSNDPRPPSRSQSRPRATSPPQEGRNASIEMTPPRTGRRNSSAREGRQRAASNNPWQHALDSTRQPAYGESAAGPSTAPFIVEDPVVETTYSQPVTDAPQRCETAFSEAQTLVRSSSQRSRSSIAKPPIAYTTAGPSSSSQPGQSGEPVPIRSMFPRYNPEISLDQQNYYPTQASPTHIPQSAISRPLYSPPSIAPATEASTSMPAATYQASPPRAAHSAPSWHHTMGQRHHEPAVMPPVNTTEELRGLWKVTNGWKATSFDGRIYCLKMAASPDLPPSYTLSSATNQPFYCLRVDPTSSSALVTLSRYDPNKPFKPASLSSSAAATMAISPSSGTSSPSPRASSSSRQSNHHPLPGQTAAHTPATTASKHQKNWQEVLSTHLAATTPTGEPLPTTTTTTTTDPRSPDQPDADADADNGLVAHLWPAAAARLVADRANDLTTVALAQQESARLVWDADSSAHFLAHPALAMPFRVAVSRHAAYSRVEYALEHLESPLPLARLVRDGTGAGWVEVDTGIAGKIEAVYLVDVAVAALVIVAHLDGGVNGAGGRGGEVFEPPPVVFGGPNGSVYSAAAAGAAAGVVGAGEGGRSSSWSERLGAASRASKREEKERKKQLKKQKCKKGGKKRPMEQFEMDLESQSSDLGKGAEKDKVPGVLRALVGLITITFKCLVWCATVAFKTLVAILSVLTRCCGLGKL